MFFGQFTRISAAASMVNFTFPEKFYRLSSKVTLSLLPVEKRITILVLLWETKQKKPTNAKLCLAIKLAEQFSGSSLNSIFNILGLVFLFSGLNLGQQATPDWNKLDQQGWRGCPVHSSLLTAGTVDTRAATPKSFTKRYKLQIIILNFSVEIEMIQRWKT